MCVLQKRQSKMFESRGAFHLRLHNTLNPLNPVSGVREREGDRRADGEGETAFEERERRSGGSTLAGRRGKIFEIIDAADRRKEEEERGR